MIIENYRNTKRGQVIDQPNPMGGRLNIDSIKSLNNTLVR